MADILIQGGGLAGNTLALALAQTNKNIIVVEPFLPSDKKKHRLESRTIALSYGSKCIYEALGVWPRLATHATPIEHIHVSDKGHFGITRLHAKQQNMPALGYVLPIAEVNQVLTTALAAYPHVQRYCPAFLRDIHLSSHRWKGILASTDQVTQTAIEADLLIATDGADSPLRKKQKLVISEKDYEQTAFVSVVDLSSPHHNTAYERFTDEGPIALLPLQDNQAALVLTVNNCYVNKWLGYSDAAFLQALQTLFGYRLGRFLAIGPRVTYPLTLQTSPVQTATQFLVMGNAANVMHPIAAQSFNLAVRDIALFAELVKAASLSKLSLTDPLLLKNYETQRTADQQRTIAFTDRLIDIFTTPVLRLPRNALMTVLEFAPPLKTLLGRYAAGALGKRTRLSRGLPL